jgi:GntR family transcriptional regulator/MocR family aminotransferase
MPKRSAGIMLSVRLEPASGVPLYRQLYDSIRHEILSGHLPPGARLPSTRMLAADLGVSRTTILSAFDQLIAEGYVQGRTGSGTRVDSTLTEASVRPSPARAAGRASAQRRRLSRRAGLADIGALLPRESPARPLRPGNPDLSAFPRQLWSRLAARHWRTAPQTLFGYGDPKGYPPLRQAITEYVRKVRGVHCDAAQVLIVGGSQQALYLCGQVLLDPGDMAWVEDPGYPGARAALAAAGARLLPIPVDPEGIMIPRGKRYRRPPKVLYVTPSHQCPLGTTTSLSRRLQLLRFARRTKAWVLEDDYDSEYRYFCRPVASLQSLDRDGRVIYLGTLSKTLIPSLRAGYLIVPPDLIEPFARARAAMDRQPAGVHQAILAEFISEGHLERHIRQTRRLYQERQEALVGGIRRELGDILEGSASDAGMYMVAWLPTGSSDTTAARAAADRGVDVMPLSAFYLRPSTRSGLVLGYGAYTVAEISEAVKKLAWALRDLPELK